MTDALPPIRIFLSPPDVGEGERKLLLDAFDSNWIAPLGPHVDAFEAEMADRLGDGVHCVALSSGTAALHLALLDLGVGPGDEVVTSTMTFAATANAIHYVGATPVFVDVDPVTWQMDPALVAEAIRDRAAAGHPPAAVVTVDLYGVCADHTEIRRVCDEHGIPIIEDAAEALGSTAGDRHAGTLGDVGVFSFNGNKIITTSGGGMLVARDADQADRIRHLATQARDPAPHYEHSQVGYNYRLSNLLAAVGRGQLASLDAKVAARREVNQRYRQLLADVPGVAFPEEPDGQRWNHWLTCLTVDPEAFGASHHDIADHLRRQGIEARPVWKPMHLQPVWAEAPGVGGEVAAGIFADGLCLPSGSALTPDQQDEVAAGMLAVRGSVTRLLAAIVVGTLVVLSSASARMFVWPPIDVPESVDAIVVLGGGEQVRLRTGLALYADGVGDALVLSSGAPDDAVDHGVHCEDAAVFCIEPEPGTTAGEASTVTALATEQGWSSLAVVTSTYHLSRARMLFGQCFAGDLSMVEASVPRARLGFLGDVVRELPDTVAGATFARAC